MARIKFKDIAERIFRDAGYRGETCSDLVSMADEAHRAYLDQFAMALPQRVVVGQHLTDQRMDLPPYVNATTPRPAGGPIPHGYSYI